MGLSTHLCLEARVQVDKERVLLARDGHEHRLLDGNALQLIAVEHLALLETLDGQHVPGGLVLRQEHLSA